MRQINKLAYLSMERIRLEWPYQSSGHFKGKETKMRITVLRILSTYRNNNTGNGFTDIDYQRNPNIPTAGHHLIRLVKSQTMKTKLVSLKLQSLRMAKY